MNTFFSYSKYPVKQRRVFFSFIILLILLRYEVYSQTKEKSYPEIPYISSTFISSDYTFNNRGLVFPIQVCLGQNNEIIVLDYAEDCLYFFDKDGKYIRTIGQRGQGPGDLLRPTGLQIDKNSDIYIYETGNNRISIFSYNGKFITSFRLKGSAYRCFTFSVTKNQEVIVNAPTTGFYITVYSRDGNILREVGSVEQLVKKPVNLIGDLIDASILNNTLGAGFPFYEENEGNYYIFLQYLPYIKIFNTKGEMIKKVDVQFPEILKIIDEIPGPGNPKLGLRLMSIYNTVAYSNNYFYVITIESETDKDGLLKIYNNTYKVDAELKILKKIVPPVLYISNEELQHFYRFDRDITSSGRNHFTISLDENTIYYAVPYQCSVIKYSKK